MGRFSLPLLTFAVAFALASIASPAAAQLPDCSGHDAAGASTEFEAGNALLTQAIEQASHRHADRAHELATQALGHFDHQCELGDTSALAERGAALLLLGDPLRSAQSYDAYLALHPLDSLDARTRRRIEPNLQPGVFNLLVSNPTGRLFVNDLDFGALPRTTGVHLPFGEYRIEVRDATGTVLVADQATLSQEAMQVEVQLIVPLPEPEVVEPEVVAPPPPPPPPPPPEAEVSHTDFLPFYIASGVAAGVGLGLGIAGLVGADERARTYNATCAPVVDPAGCNAVLSERETFLGLGIAGFVLAGLGVAGVIVSYVLDSSQPRAHVHIAFGPTGASIAGTF